MCWPHALLFQWTEFCLIKKVLFLSFTPLKEKKKKKKKAGCGGWGAERTRQKACVCTWWTTRRCGCRRDTPNWFAGISVPYFTTALIINHRFNPLLLWTQQDLGTQHNAGSQGVSDRFVTEKQSVTRLKANAVSRLQLPGRQPSLSLSGCEHSELALPNISMFF